MTFAAVDPDEIKDLNLGRELDKAKAEIFRSGKNSAFYGSIMCGLEFIWTRDTATAATDGVRLYWNPDFFKRCDTKTNAFVLLHELKHAAHLHVLRRQGRDPEDWNIACDYRINNDNLRETFTFSGVTPFFDHGLDSKGRISEEQIYDLIKQNKIPPPPAGGGGGSSGGSGYSHWEQGDGGGDILDVAPEDVIKAVNNVVSAVHVAKSAGEHVDSTITDTISKFLKPVIPWKSKLRRFCTDQMDMDRTWARPNRRYTDIYLPGVKPEDGRLEHLLFFQDVSGSISMEDSTRFNSELKHVWDELQPLKMTIAQFDTRIRKVDVIEDGDRYEWVEIVGRGGTSLDPVRKMILDQKPTAAIIFSDLYCEVMNTQGIKMPLLWVCIGNTSAEVQRGELIHIKQ